MMKYCLVHGGLATEDYKGLPDCVWVYCPPPDELDLDGWEWTMSLLVPDAEEMAQMDESAYMLKLDLEMQL